jgi:hypothetical protein
MKRWVLLSIIAVIIVVASVMAVRNHVRSVAQKKREAAYQSALQKYSQDLRPGLRRTEVEGYLRARNVSFSWIYTAFGGRRESQYADIVKIGEEAAPWYCSEAYVYVAFEFSGGEKFKQDDSDLLERIEIFRPYTGCL